MNHGSDRPFLETRAANFPALMYCVSFLELLSCLYAGSMRGNDANSAPCKVKRYAESFMGYTEETVQELALLFAMFRNKVAHATQPQGVFDPPTEWVPKQWRNETEWKRVTWTVSPGLRPVAITLGREDGTVDAPPWPLKYEYRCTVSLPLLAHQIIASALGENGYLQSLPGDSDARGNFADCMGDLFPPGADWMPPS